MMQHYLLGNRSIFWISIALAAVALVLMVLNRRTRPALLYPVVVGLVSAGPYLMFVLGAPMSNRELMTAYGALSVAPWIFLLTSAVVAPIYLLKSGREANPSSHDSGARPSFWWGFNFVFPFAVLLTAIPYVANSDWLYMFPQLRELIFSKGHTPRFLFLSVLLNYFVVAAVLAVVSHLIGVFRLINPATYGMGALLLVNGLELIRALLIAYFIYSWKDESFFIRVSEVNQLFVWPLRLAAAIGIGTIALSNLVNAKSNRPMQPTAASGG